MLIGKVNVKLMNLKKKHIQYNNKEKLINKNQKYNLK